MQQTSASKDTKVRTFTSVSAARPIVEMWPNDDSREMRSWCDARWEQYEGGYGPHNGKVQVIHLFEINPGTCTATSQNSRNIRWTMEISVAKSYQR
jgi:hypothetical protein